MRRETATLLRVIGEDYPVGTHASTDKYAYLAQSVRTGEDYHRIFLDDSLNKKGYHLAMRELPEFFGQMSQEAFRRLMSFARLLDFHLDSQVGQAVKWRHTLPSYSPEQLPKRLLMLQTFSGLKPSLYSLAELRNEKEIKREYPWQWIDLVETVDLVAAKRETVVKLTSKKPDFDAFKERIVHYYSSLRQQPQGQELLQSILKSLAGKIPDKKLKELKREAIRFK